MHFCLVAFGHWKHFEFLEVCSWGTERVLSNFFKRIFISHVLGSYEITSQAAQVAGVVWLSSRGMIGVTLLSRKESMQESEVVLFTCHRDQRSGFQKESQAAEWRMQRYLPWTPHNLSLVVFPTTKLPLALNRYPLTAVYSQITYNTMFQSDA